MSAGDVGASRHTRPASLQRRALALIYEALLLVALLLISSLPFVMLAREAGWADARPLFQVYLVAMTGAYYAWQWKRGGQTLALKTWRLGPELRGCCWERPPGRGHGQASRYQNCHQRLRS